MSANKLTRNRYRKAPLIDISDVATMLGLTVQAVHEGHADGKIPAPLIVVGERRWRFSELTKWIEEGCPRPAFVEAPPPQVTCRHGPVRCRASPRASTSTRPATNFERPRSRWHHRAASRRPRVAARDRAVSLKPRRTFRRQAI